MFSAPSLGGNWNNRLVSPIDIFCPLIEKQLSFIYSLVWYGCFMGSGASECTSDTLTRLSTNAQQYRHFAVDTTSSPVTKKIIYFCDLNPYRPGMFCYCSDRLSGETNTWSGMYIHEWMTYLLNLPILRSLSLMHEIGHLKVWDIYSCFDGAPSYILNVLSFNLHVDSSEIRPGL